MFIEKWIGIYLNGRGEPDIQICDWNPGHLAHTFRTRFEVPDETIEHLQRRLPCVVIDKFGKPTGPCEQH